MTNKTEQDAQVTITLTQAAAFVAKGAIDAVNEANKTGKGVVEFSTEDGFVIEMVATKKEAEKDDE
jgi:hypothetical protein